MGTVCEMWHGLRRYDPGARLSAAGALRHPYFANAPPPASDALMQRYLALLPSPKQGGAAMRSAFPPSAGAF